MDGFDISKNVKIKHLISIVVIWMDVKSDEEAWDELDQFLENEDKISI